MFFGVCAEQQSLENVARPLTAEETGPGGPPYAPGMAGTGRTAVMADRSHNEEIDEVAAALEPARPEYG
ncbi:hypothetical protein [Streptomyces sp. NPDC046759]|uniref:hypothetical protein n=1 Tax=Streptomyces sp. NPDC046759 TaxID=3155019 RepID=UPI0033DF2551